MRSLNGLLLLLLFPAMVSGQQNQTITQVESGDHKFAKGAILVSLNDTVSSEFVERQFDKLGYRILKNDIRPVTGYFRQNLTQKQLTVLSSHPYISNIEIHATPFDEKGFLRSVKEQNLSARDSLRRRNMLLSLAENPFHRVLFKYYVTEEMARTFNETVPEYGMKINPAIPRSVVIETTPGKEKDVIKDVKRLIYVTNTAYLILDDRDQQ